MRNCTYRLEALEVLDFDKGSFQKDDERVVDSRHETWYSWGKGIREDPGPVRAGRRHRAASADRGTAIVSGRANDPSPFLVVGSP